MSERAKFIVEWERRWEALEGRGVNVAELCRIHGVSRQTGHLWLARYLAANRDLRALEDGSRRPKTNPRAVTSELEDFIVAARKQKPRWGPVLLRAWLVERYPRYPFTLLDCFSRLLLRCEALHDPDGAHVISILDSAFCEFGTPDRIRSDGGPPFFSAKSPASLSKVGIWLLRLGITLECIAPGKPQQNGRLERFHRTLKLEVAPAASLRPQQKAFDENRGVYNFERPHSALGLVPPWTVYDKGSMRFVVRTDPLEEPAVGK